MPALYRFRNAPGAVVPGAGTGARLIDRGAYLGIWRTNPLDRDYLYRIEALINYVLATRHT